MEYGEFVTEVKKRLSEKLGGDYEIECKNMLKNNSCIYRGIIIKNLTDDNKVAPAIYMENWYDEFKSGKNIDTIVESIISVYTNCCKMGYEMQLDKLADDFEPERLFYRLVNFEKNVEMLSDCPFIPFLDLAITFHYLCFDKGTEIHSFRITDDIMEKWGINVEYLIGEAEKNMKRLFPDKLMSLGGMIRDMIESGNSELCFGEFEYDDVEPNMYVLTNEYGINGAAALLYSTKLQQLAAELDSDIYILPSSIHEVIMVSADTIQSTEWLKNLVKEVNFSVVNCEEQLSDNVYLFERNSGNVSML
ncbi:MAG: hypothetical protein E7265_03020 [Lachnospiraceae bacterium]|nr:hypothetical protein [Lachnospiraceae bacterium]